MSGHDSIHADQPDVVPRPVVLTDVATTLADAATWERSALAIFDLDRTLVRGSSLALLGRELLRRGLLSTRGAVDAALRNAVFTGQGASDDTAHRACRVALRHLHGLSADAVRDTLPSVVDATVQRLYRGGRLLVDLHRDRGDFCVLVSAAPHELVEGVARHLGIPRAVGTRAAVVEGRFTGELSGPFCYGPDKLVRLADELGPVDLRTATAYSDSASDLPLLRACGAPVAVHPDRALRAEARRRGWPIMHFDGR